VINRGLFIVFMVDFSFFLYYIYGGLELKRIDPQILAAILFGMSRKGDFK